MRNIEYKEYTKREMINIIRKDGFVFVETNLGDHFIINKKDIADFIILETLRTKHTAEIYMYLPGEDKPILTTYGWFLNKINPILREEIIKRLVSLQTNTKNPRNVKIFNNDTFCKMSKTEMGINNGKIVNFDRLYKKYNM